MEEMKIDVAAIRDLRAATGAGIMDCRRALAESGGDRAAAEELLKAWGQALAAKRSERPVGEGRIFIHAAKNPEGDAGERIAMVSIGCETDFVARNELFIEAGDRIAALACADWHRAAEAGADTDIGRAIAELGLRIKENIVLNRVAALESGPGGRLESYLHDDGRTGVILKASSASLEALEAEETAAFLHDLALHIAAFAPEYVRESDVPRAHIEEKEAEFRKEMETDERLAGKPGAMLAGILAGKSRKYLASICLMDQGFIRDEKVPVSRALQAVAEKRGAAITIEAFCRFRIPEES